MSIKQGDSVKVEYVGSLEDGTIFDSSEKSGKPLEFKVGEKMVIPGFEEGILSMAKGEEKEIKIDSSEAYGEHLEELVKKLPKKNLPDNQEPKVGMILVLGTPDGRQLPARVTEVSKDEITIDLNHPLAGKNLIFKVKLIEVHSN